MESSSSESPESTQATSAETMPKTKVSDTNAAPEQAQQWPAPIAPSSRSGLRAIGEAFLRYHILFLFYFLWIFWVTIYLLLLLYSAIKITMTVLSANAIPLPISVQVFLATIAVYFAYQNIVMPKEQKPWPWLMEYVRWMFVHYPYFRKNRSIFEECEEDSIKHPHKPMVKAKDKGMYVMHPHGVFAVGVTVNSALAYRFAEADHRCLVAQNLFIFPFSRDLLRWLGFDNVKKECLQYHMRQDRNVCLYPGGLEEMSLFQNGKHRVYLKKRFGFVKLALQYGYKLYPAYTFGEEQTYSTFPFLLRLRMWLCSLRLPGVMFVGNRRIPFMPRTDIDLTTVVGKPIQMPHIEHPTREDVQKYHNLYMDAVMDLFERNKAKYAVDPTSQLEFY